MKDTTTVKHFDLNIEKVLEDWEIFHALREIIANAIDEQMLTKTAPISIHRDDQDTWHIRDYGRGLKYEHLTQNENEEKLNQPNLVIGKFGVGLKDALAVLNRHSIDLSIKSKYGDITLDKSPKHDFENIVTLHALITEPSEPTIVGTDFVLSSVMDSDVELAKEFFLLFSDEHVIESTSYGQVLQHGHNSPRIYINGVRVAQEDNFLFSYNITSLTQTMRKALNRERTHVGRSAYTDRVKAILLECKHMLVHELLTDDLNEHQTGKSHDELKWIEVAVYASKILNASGKVIFLTASELVDSKAMVDQAASDGLKIVIVPDSVKGKLQGQTDVAGNPIRDLIEYTDDWNDSFEFEFVDPIALTPSEKAIYDKTDNILKLVGGKPRAVKKILISNTMRMDTGKYQEVLGVWEASSGSVIIKRTELRNLEGYAGTLLHEIAHANSGASDVSREFEAELTLSLGKVTGRALVIHS